MPLPRNERRLVLVVGMLLFLLSCAYVPWERRYYQVVGVHGPNIETHLEYHYAAPSETRYGWFFSRPVTPKSMFTSPDVAVVQVSADINVHLLVVEWLGICLFSGGMALLLKRS